MSLDVSRPVSLEEIAHLPMIQLSERGPLGKLLKQSFLHLETTSRLLRLYRDLLWQGKFPTTQRRRRQNLRKKESSFVVQCTPLIPSPSGPDKTDGISELTL